MAIRAGCDKQMVGDQAGRVGRVGRVGWVGRVGRVGWVGRVGGWAWCAGCRLGVSDNHSLGADQMWTRWAGVVMVWL